MFSWLFSNPRAEDRIDRIFDGLREPLWKSETRHVPADLMLTNVKVYDYNRHGVVAFKADGIDTELLKAWADGRVNLTIAVYAPHDDEEA